MNYDRIILELIDRISVLEDEVAALKVEKLEEHKSLNSTQEIYSVPTYNGRDTTKYMLDGRKYGKNRLVLAIVKKYMEFHPDTTASLLMITFDKSLQGSLGVVRTVSDVKSAYADCERRFFLRPDEVIKTSTDDCAVCSQWGTFNISNIITRANELGITVKEIKWGNVHVRKRV